MSEYPRRPKAAVVTGHGINAHVELAYAFDRAGAESRFVHFDGLAEHPGFLRDIDILALPGGFSFGDHTGSGKVLAFRIRRSLLTSLTELIARNGLVIGICNGFQVLAKSGLLAVGTEENRPTGRPNVSLVHNRDGRFVDRWVRLSVNVENDSPWLTGLSELELPIRHGEGRFVTMDEQSRTRMHASNQVALRYLGENPNGSVDSVAGITDPTGHVLGLMPHPEAYHRTENHPRWTRRAQTEPNGLSIFRNAVAYCRAKRR